MEKLINTLNELSAELATQPETWKQMAIIKAISTIEALQQQLEQYDQDRTAAQQLWGEECEECIKLQQEIEQLQAQNGAMREALKQVQHDIDGAECRDDLDGIKGYIDGVLAAIDKIGGREDV